MFTTKKIFTGLIAATAALCFLGPTPAYTQQSEMGETVMEKGMQNHGRRVGHHMFSRYPMPNDPEAFDKHYLPHHVQLATTNQDVLSIILSDGTPIVKQQGPAKDRNTNLHKVAFTTYPTLPASQVSLNTPEGIVTGQDIDNYATGGLSLVFYDANEIMEQNRI